MTTANGWVSAGVLSMFLFAAQGAAAEEPPVKILPAEPPAPAGSASGWTVGAALSGSVLFHTGDFGDLGNLAMGVRFTGGYRFSPHWLLAARLTLAAIVGTPQSGAFLAGVGGELRYRFRPLESVVPWVGVAAGFEYRGLTIETGLGSSRVEGIGLQLPELMAGVDFRATSSLRIGLYVGAATGLLYAAQTFAPFTLVWLDSGIRGEYDL